MKSESNVKPNIKFQLENIIDGKCEIVFYDNVKEVSSLDDEEKKYSYDLYRFKTNYRDNLEKELNDNIEIFKKWLKLAKNTEHKENAEREIAKLQEELDNTDYKIIKCSEYQLLGLKMPYDVAELHLTRQKLRDKINELRESEES